MSNNSDWLDRFREDYIGVLLVQTTDWRAPWARTIGGIEGRSSDPCRLPGRERYPNAESDKGVQPAVRDLKAGGL